MSQPFVAEQTDKLSPEEALKLLEKQARHAENILASQPDLEPDLLRFLAEKGAPATRRAVAANPGTCAEANLLLADDQDQDVRKVLASKIGRLFPGLLAEEQKQLRDMAIATLEKLAQDEVTEVRAALAEEIKHHDCVPRPIVQALANDADPAVGLPMIEFSPQMEDEDLIQLVVASRASSILSAIARRKKLSGDVCEAVATTLDIDAVSALLANTDAAIRTKTLDKIISQAAEVAEWHGPLVVRADLSQTAIRRLAGFVGSTMIDDLMARSGLDDSTRNHIKHKLEARKKAEAKADAAMIAALRTGAQTEAFVTAAVESCRKDTVVKALAVLAKTDDATVRRVLDSKSPKSAISLVWRAGLSMRVAFQLQVQVMRLAGNLVIPARRGIDFPLTEEEMHWHLDYFGIK
ncbi:MAG: DUF2336 domain-containing protein [Rhizomicrobium sp.]|nr:DUF2336 domain-containing protein [Rhizomicrobium sp.]